MFRVTDHNYKNALLEIAQGYFGVERPQYIHFDYGPHHAKVFRCICSFHQKMTSSIGRTKIEAEKLASQAMLNKIQHLCFKQINTEWIFSTTEESAVLPSRILSILDNLKHDSCFDVLSLSGDAIVRYVIAQYLYDYYSEFREGILMLIIAEAMREETRAQVAINLKLETYVRTQITTRTWADTLSAVIGKLNLLALDNLAKKLVLDYYQPFIDHSVSIILGNSIAAGERVTGVEIKTTIHNFKNELQEYAQRYGFPLPSYYVISKEGVEHAPTFTVKCVFKRMEKIGEGITVKAAEQNAARSALENIYLEDVDKERFVRRSQTYASFSASDSSANERDLAELKHHLHLPSFVTLSHLTRAFIHSSLDAENNYQRLEFLGDAILRMLIIDYLLHQYPKIIDKAFLSPLVDHLVSAQTQIKIAKRLQLNKYILSSTAITDGMLGDVLEALIAAIYIDAEIQSRGANFCNSAVPVIIDWFKPEIMHSLGPYHLATDGTVGSDNFPALTSVATAAKATVSTDTQTRSYAGVATTKQVTRKPQSISEPVPKIQEDFPPLRTLTAKTKTNDSPSKLSYVTPTIQTQISTGMASASTDTQARSYAGVVTTKQVTKKPQFIFWSAPKIQEDFPPLRTANAKTKTTNGPPKFS